MEKLFEINNNGLNIKCKIYSNNSRNIRRVIVSCHGLCGSKDNAVTDKLAHEFLKKYDDMAVISFDWPCHGKDVKQKLDLDDCESYLGSIINYINADLGVNEIYVQATSFGGYVVLNYISEHGNPFKKIALRCPAVNMYEAMLSRILTQEQLEQLRKNKPVEIGFERKIKITPEFLAELKSSNILEREFFDYSDDILVIHGNQDEVVDYDTDRRFCDDNVIEFITINGADHRFRDPAKLRECLNNIVGFYEQGMNEERTNMDNTEEQSETEREYVSYTDTLPNGEVIEAIGTFEKSPNQAEIDAAIKEMMQKINNTK